ncbi:MAG: hypothetical protein KJ955_07215 [Nanoarchaeota archaeon]|nr:hypothetical protein [Nanoarchaeota archaeon]
MADNKKKGDKPEAPKVAKPKVPKVKDKKDLLTKASEAVKNFDKAEDLETKLKGHVSPEMDAEIQDVVEQRAMITTAFQKGLSTYLNANTDKYGIVKQPSAEFADGLSAALYKSFGDAMSVSAADVEALTKTAKFGKSNTTPTRAYRLLFKSMTGLNLEGLKEGLQGTEQIEYGALMQTIMEPVVENVGKFLVDESVDKVMPVAGTDEGNATIKKLADILGMKLKPKDMLTPQQRASAYHQALKNAINKYGAEYLPKYGEKA